jgi:hypothetical protein
MISFKWRSLIFALVIILTFAFIANARAAEADNNIIGDWECVVETEDNECFVFFLYIAGPNDVTYIAGWYLSEIAAMYAGQYSIEDDNVLNLEMTDTESADTLIGSFSFSVSEGVLTLVNESGDCLTNMFEAGVPMEFHAVKYSPMGMRALGEIDEDAP